MSASTATLLAAVITVGSALIFAAVKSIRQSGRIEEGVKGLYGRMERIERWIDAIRDRRK